MGSRSVLAVLALVACKDPPQPLVENRFDDAAKARLTAALDRLREEAKAKDQPVAEAFKRSRGARWSNALEPCPLSKAQIGVDSEPGTNQFTIQTLGLNAFYGERGLTGGHLSEIEQLEYELKSTLAGTFYDSPEARERQELEKLKLKSRPFMLVTEILDEERPRALGTEAFAGGGLIARYGLWSEEKRDVVCLAVVSATSSGSVRIPTGWAWGGSNEKPTERDVEGAANVDLIKNGIVLALDGLKAMPPLTEPAPAPARKQKPKR